MTELYSSIKETAQHEIKIDGSRFIGLAIPVEQDQDIRLELENVRNRYHDATHHCFAYALGPSRSYFKYSDDGEPGGTAGIKIFHAIQTADISDVLVIVTRYFGGIKLGVGGLGRAYYESALSAIRSAKSVRKGEFTIFALEYSFEELHGIQRYLHSHSIKLIGTEYLENTIISTVPVLPSMVQSFTTDLLNITKGKIQVSEGGKRILRI